jgi:hypothetical protein
MAGLLDIFGTSGQETLGLLGGDVGRSRDDAQAQALYALAGSLLSGGPTGLSIVRGLQQGQQAYRQAMRGSLEEQLQGVQVQDLLRKRKLEEDALRRQQMIDTAVARAYQPGVAASPNMFYGEQTQMPLRDDEGNLMPGATPAVAAQAPRLDLQRIAPALMASREGRATLADLVKAQEAMQPKLQTLKKGEQLGIVQDGQFKPIAGGPKQVSAGEDNPFLMFSQDQTIPANIRSLAGQYAKSYSNGLIDAEKVDERVRQLSEMTQRVQQFEQTQAGLQAQREASNILAQGNQQIQQMLAQAKLEEKAAKAAEKANTKSEAKDQLTATVDQLKGKYDTLLKEGGIVSTQAGGLQNIGARLSSSGVGRAIGGAVGTKTQEQRQAIEQTRPLLLNLIKNATGMSAQQMNSNAEMQLYLNAATNPDLSYEANMEALKNLDRLFGLGTAADKIEKSVTAPQRPGQSRSGW